MLRASAASNSASTDWAWTVAKTSALVVPFLSSSSRKKPATSSAWPRSVKAASARKDVAFEPFEQLAAISGDAVRLGIMDMRVDEAGHNQARQAVDRHARKARRKIGMIAERDDQAVLDDEQPIGMVADRAALSGIFGDAQQLGAKGVGGHAAPLAQRQDLGKCGDGDHRGFLAGHAG